MAPHLPPPPLLPLLLLTSCALGAPDSVGRLSPRQAPQHRGRLCSLGTCQTHRLPEILFWLRSASTKQPSGKAGREPHDPHSYGRRRRREATALLRPQDPSPRGLGASAVPSLLGDVGHVSAPVLAAVCPPVYWDSGLTFLP